MKIVVKVYVVMKGSQWGIEKVLGVYSTKEKAEAACLEYNDSQDLSPMSAWFAVYEVDGHPHGDENEDDEEDPE